MVNLAQDVKPVSYMRDHSMEILDYVENSRSPIVITHDGEAKAVIIDINSYQKTINAINLAKLLSFVEKDIKNGNLISHEEAKKIFEKTLSAKNNEKD
jgi:PHD/YefM family antitoxin component YafN of YafNO toxin-antitoxin module